MICDIAEKVKMALVHKTEKRPRGKSRSFRCRIIVGVRGRCELDKYGSNTLDHCQWRVCSIDY